MDRCWLEDFALEVAEDARLRERERIARELHDTLLQSSVSLVLGFQAVALQMPEKCEVRLQMESVLDQAESLIDDARKCLQGLRSEGVDDLYRALSRLGEGLRRCRPVAFVSRSVGTPRPLKHDACQEVYRLGREALFNSFRHAQANRVDMLLDFQVTHLRLCIQDDGRGMVPGLRSVGQIAGHWGLTGMRERARSLGATLRIGSLSGRGTVIDLTVPAAAAYERVPDSRSMNNSTISLNASP